MVKVEDTAQEIPKQAFTAKDRAGNDHLPAGAHDGGRFRKKYIPTVIAYISPLLDAFKFSDKELLNIYQASWNTVYGSVVPYKIEVRDAVFNIVTFLLDSRMSSNSDRFYAVDFTKDLRCLAKRHRILGAFRPQFIL